MASVDVSVYSLTRYTILQTNPDYEHAFVFTNDYSAMLPDTPSPGICAYKLVLGVYTIALSVSHNFISYVRPIRRFAAKSWPRSGDLSGDVLPSTL